MNNDVFMYYADCRMKKSECSGNKQCINKNNYSDRGSIYYSIVITFNNF